MACLRDRRHRFVRVRVGIQGSAQGQTQARRHNQRRRRACRADVREAVGEGVVEVEHVAGGGCERRVCHHSLPDTAHRRGGPLSGAGARARQPVGERDRVCRLEAHSRVARITSDALTIAVTLAPSLSPSSSTASTVIEATSRWPATSTATFAIASPLRMSVTVPCS